MPSGDVALEASTVGEKDDDLVPGEGAGASCLSLWCNNEMHNSTAMEDARGARPLRRRRRK